MNRTIVRGLIILIALVGIAGVFLLIGQKTDTESVKVYNEPSEEILQKIRDDLAAQKTKEAAKSLPAKENPEKGDLHADGTWHEGEHDTPVAENFDSDEKYKLPDDVFSDAYTEKLKALVQTCVELYHLPQEIRTERGFDKAWGGIYDARNDAQNIINHFFSTYDETYAERYREIMKIIEPYNALVPRPNTPMPESLQRLKEITPEMADRIDEIWRKP